MPSKSGAICDHCDGTGEVWETCPCYQCEYGGQHDRNVPCLNCEGTGLICVSPRLYVKEEHR